MRLSTGIPEAMETVNVLINHYISQLNGINVTNLCNKERITSKIHHLELAKEGLERLNPMGLTDESCPVCGFGFYGGGAFYCPKCGQAIVDFTEEYKALNESEGV